MAESCSWSVATSASESPNRARYATCSTSSRLIAIVLDLAPRAVRALEFGPAPMADYSGGEPRPKSGRKAARRAGRPSERFASDEGGGLLVLDNRSGGHPAANRGSRRVAELDRKRSIRLSRDVVPYGLHGDSLGLFARREGERPVRGGVVSPGNRTGSPSAIYRGVVHGDRARRHRGK